MSFYWYANVPVPVPNAECVQCGTQTIVENNESAPCPDGRPGCLVAHFARIRRCTTCRGMTYQKVETTAGMAE